MSAPGQGNTETQPLPLLAGAGLLREAGRDERAAELEREVVALFDGYRTRLLGYVSVFGIPAHDGEEVVQEVFLALFSHLRQGKPRSNLRGWLFRVAHNLALKQRLANRRWPEAAPAEPAAETAQDPSPDPERQLLSMERRRRLLAVLNALPEQDRLCFTLRGEGLRYREIAKILGISLGSVSVSLTRSLARLMRADGMGER